MKMKGGWVAILLLVVLLVGSSIFWFNQNKSQVLTFYCLKESPKVLKIVTIPFGYIVEVTEQEDIEEFYEILGKYRTIGRMREMPTEAANTGWQRRIIMDDKVICRLRQDCFMLENGKRFLVDDINGLVVRIKNYENRMGNKYGVIEGDYTW